MRKIGCSFVFRLAALLLIAAMSLSLTSCGYTIRFEKTEPSDGGGELVTEYTFDEFGSKTVLGGYLSGYSSPSVSANLSEVFDIKALASKGYKCNVTVNYNVRVEGDHLNVRCSFGGVSSSAASYTYLDHNESSSLSHSAYNIDKSVYKEDPTITVTWDCKGVTGFDGLNECTVFGIEITVKFSK